MIDINVKKVTTCNEQFPIKYQGVKEFHILAGIDCYCKIMVFSYLKLRSHIITHPSVTMMEALLTAEGP